MIAADLVLLSFTYRILLATPASGEGAAGQNITRSETKTALDRSFSDCYNSDVAVGDVACRFC